MVILIVAYLVIIIFSIHCISYAPSNNASDGTAFDADGESNSIQYHCSKTVEYIGVNVC
jgi:hypothetical protein